MESMREEVNLYLKTDMSQSETSEVYNCIEDGFIEAIRIYYAMGTTMACIKTKSKQYYANWEDRTQREIFLMGIGEDTLIYDERQRPLFYEI